MKKEFTFPVSPCHRISCLFLVLFLFALGLVAQEPANENGHLFRITEGLKSPIRLTIDNQGIVYVSDAFQKSIVTLDTSGNFLEKINPGGFPIAIAVSDDNQLFISDNDKGAIKKLVSDGETIEINSTCNYPSDAVFDGDNKLYVVDSKQKQVIVMDLSGNVVQTIGEGILVLPTGIAYDKKNARILVVEHGGLTSSKTGLLGAEILVFDLQGNLLDTFGEFGFEEGQFTRIQGLDVDRWGRIYIVDNYQAIVSVFSEDGDFITRFGEFGDEPGQLNSPMDVAVDARNRIWVSSMNTSSVEVFGMKEIGLDVSGELISGDLDLLQNYPNPFRQGTWIPFILSEDGQPTLNIFNINGNLVRTIKPGFLPKGNYTDSGRALFWDGNSNDGTTVETGIYFYELKMNDSRKVRRMVLLK